VRSLDVNGQRASILQALSEGDPVISAGQCLDAVCTEACVFRHINMFWELDLYVGRDEGRGSK
jgi:hypothetical protein